MKTIEACFAVLLWLYPAAFREEYEREMRAAFRRRWREETNALGLVWMCLSIFADTLVTSLQEHAAMFLQDVRYSLRSLRQNKAFTAAVVATLALGVGATTAVYSLVHTVLVRPLPFAEPDRLVRIWETNLPMNIPFFSSSVLNFLSWRERTESFDVLVAMQPAGVNLTGDGEPQRVDASAASVEFWSMTGLAPIRGRAFSTEEDQPGRDGVVMIGEGLWRRRYGGDPAILGRTILLDGTPRTVVGIAPHDVGFRSGVDVWIPLAPEPAKEDRGNHVVAVVGRLKRGVDMERASAELNSIAEGLEREFPASNRGWRTRMAPVIDAIVDRESRTNLYVLFGAVGLLFLVACANIAGLLVTRATARESELSVRLALGASRSRLLRQLATESLVLSAIGGGIGLLTAFGAVRWLAAKVSTQLPRTSDLTLDWQVAVFGFGLALGAGLLFGLAPVWFARRRDMQTALRQSGRAAVAGRATHARLALIGAQMAMAAMLLVGALLLIQSFARLQRVELGFQPDHLLTARVRLPAEKYGAGDKAAVFYRTLMEEVRSLPGVVSAGVTSAVPFGAPNTSMPVVPVQRPSGIPERGIQAFWRMATADYLRTLKVPLRRGRLGDSNNPLDIVLSENLERALWPDGTDSIGRTVRLGNGQVFTVVGIVGDVRHLQLSVDPMPTMYFAPSFLAGLTLVVRTEGDPASLAGALRQAVRRLDPSQPVDNIRTMERVIEQNAERPYLQAVLFGAFAALALILGAVGVGGVVAYTVERRVPDLAIRMALGATPGQAMGAAARGGLTAAGAGLVIGLAGAWGLGSFLSSLLYRVRADDPTTFGLVGVVLIVISIVACWVPARRVVRIDPVVALRSE